MPIYEYECGQKHRFEKWQSINDEPLKDCPTCGSSVRKVIHPAGIIFKGSGWYITDSRKPSSGDSKGDTKSETKSDSTSEAKNSEAKTNSEAKKNGESKKTSETKSD